MKLLQRVLSFLHQPIHDVVHVVINSRRTCAARVAVLGLCVSVCVCVCVCLCVYVSVTQHLTFHVIICATNNTNLLSGGWRPNSLSDFLWKCFIAKLKLFLLVRLHDKLAIFFSVDNAHAYESGHVASGHFVLGETFFANSIIAYWQLAVSMPPTKVCPQCKAAVPVGRKTCEHCGGGGSNPGGPPPPVWNPKWTNWVRERSLKTIIILFTTTTKQCYNYYINWSFVAITVNTSVHVQVFTVTSILFTHNCV